MARCGNTNYMDQLHDIICAIANTKPEPEVCNARCPPLGCPKGSCVGVCCYRGTCDACCVSQMPCCPPLPEPPACCISRGPHQMRQPHANPHPTTASRPMPQLCPPGRKAAAIDQCQALRFRNSGRSPHGPDRPATCS